MTPKHHFTAIKSLGECRFDSPLPLNTTLGDDIGNFTSDEQRVRGDVYMPAADNELVFEKAGPRQKLFFDPATARAAIVTCGGLCPGLNNVIRSVVVALQMNYGVHDVLGIRYGYQGLSPDGEPPVKLTLDMVDGIDKKGGTILGSSRGTPTSAEMADFLERRTDRHALLRRRRRHAARRARLARGNRTPRAENRDRRHSQDDRQRHPALRSDVRLRHGDRNRPAGARLRHVESKGVNNGVGLVKLMGRDSGFIAVGATLASQEVNFTLIPEQKFALHGERGFLTALEERILNRKHAVIALAEGAGQHLFPAATIERDASGNVKFQDIGPFLKQQILDHFAKRSIPVDVKYIDPSYYRPQRAGQLRRQPALRSARPPRRPRRHGRQDRRARWPCCITRSFTSPSPLATAERRQVNLEGEGWSSVLAATGQPREFV